MDDEHTVAPSHSHLFAAIGSALNSKRDLHVSLQEMQNRLEGKIKMDFEVERMEPLFSSEAEYNAFKERHDKHQVPVKDLSTYHGKVFLGIDAGSTTTKAALVGEDGTFCTRSITTMTAILSEQLSMRSKTFTACSQRGKEIVHSCSTG